MDFEQLVIQQPQKHAITLEFEISGSIDRERCRLLVKIVALFVQQILQLMHPSIKVNYSICSITKKAFASVELPPLQKY